LITLALMTGQINCRRSTHVAFVNNRTKECPMVTIMRMFSTHFREIDH